MLFLKMLSLLVEQFSEDSFKLNSIASVIESSQYELTIFIVLEVCLSSVEVCKTF